MDSGIDNEWLGIKPDQVDEGQVVGNIARSWQWRERGVNPPHYPPNKLVLENVAEDILVQKPLKIRSCDLPGYPRSTFLMVFSPDGTKVASTHGNHNVYVSELASGKHVRILKGHPRTPWCIAFHPSHTQLIGSGCLGGQVRVWDIASGGSEVWNVRNETVIASIAFHPREQLLVIATYNELYFWDWSQPAPFTKVCTNNVNEKVRYVAFDALGYKLITGISLRGNVGSVVASNTLLAQAVGFNTNPTNNNRREDGDNTGGVQPGDNSGSAQDMIVNSYQNLVQRYDSLVRNYQRLFMVRNRLHNPPVPTTMDRGTDPMETDQTADNSTWVRTGSSRQGRQNTRDGDEAQRSNNGENNGEAESGSRLLNLDVLSLENDRSRNQEPTTIERTAFGSRSSAFQPLGDNGRSSGMGEQTENTTRLLPNPFSSSNSTTRASRIALASAEPRMGTDNANTSRTSIFTSTRSGSITRRIFVFRRHNVSPARRDLDSSRGDSSTSTESATQPSPPRRVPHIPISEAELRNLNERRRPPMANSSTQMSPTTAPLDAQTLNESLDLIRDILRDSGTRLLNLITDMSLSMLAGTDSVTSWPGDGWRPYSAEAERTRRARAEQRPSRPRPRLFNSGWRREFLSSTSGSDSDNTLEVNILRTRNSTFREENSGSTDRASTSEPTSGRAFSTDRMVFELSGDSQREGSTHDSNGVNVSLTNDRFRVRTQSGSGGEQATAATADEPAQSRSRPPSAPDFSRPSTSHDPFWTTNACTVPPAEAYRKVRSGLSALHKHTVQLVNLSQRRTRTTPRELRVMWENLRRRILTLHRETGMSDVPSYYTRSLLERCMMLAEMSDSAPRNTRPTGAFQRDAQTNRNESNRPSPSTSRNTNASASGARQENQAAADGRNARDRQSEIFRSRSAPEVPTTTAVRRRLLSSNRWRCDDEPRRRARNPATNRLSQRHPNRSRREISRTIEINATRHEIRMRAMQVLSAMFNMMMMCLEERGLSQVIIIMLRTLKKALALTCYMLMLNINNVRPGLNTGPNSQPLATMDVVRIQNVDDAGPVNVDGPDEPTRNEQDKQEDVQKEPTRTVVENRSFSHRGTGGNAGEVLDLSASSSSFPTQRWSNRLAVQIAAANRNNSATARSRRDLYLESKRLKALHRTNPSAHPLIKKRVMPPITTYRIPSLRSAPHRCNPLRVMTSRREPPTSEPVAGPSNATNEFNTPPSPESTNQEVPRNDGMSEIDERVNFIRIASQAIRNTPRNRFRRLQTIRLYTPSTVREMFAVQANNAESQESRSPSQNNPEIGSRRPLNVYRPHVAAPHSDSPPDVAATPAPAAAAATPATPATPAAPPALQSPGLTVHRLPRIHDYLQPIILAQNAMVVEDDGLGSINPGNGANGGGDNVGGGGGAPHGGVPYAGGPYAGAPYAGAPYGGGPYGGGPYAGGPYGGGPYGNGPYAGGPYGGGPYGAVAYGGGLYSGGVAGTGGVSGLVGGGAGAAEGGGGALGSSLSGLVGGGRRLSGMAGLLDAGIISEALPAPSHRVQAWDFTTGDAPDIADTTKNVVVQRCRIHNDASIDISRDGRLLVALLPVPRLRNTNHWLGVYSLEWARLGQCLHTAVMEQAAVSVALSPTARHLAVGLGSRRFTTQPHSRNNVFALLYRLDPLESSSRTGLSPVKELEQNWEHGFTSLNCLRWAPQPGQGLVYANNTGQLIIMS